MKEKRFFLIEKLRFILIVIFLLVALITGTFIRNPWVTIISLVVGSIAVIGMLYYSGYLERRIKRYDKRNDNWSSAVQTTLELFSKAEAGENIKILSGYLHADFYSHTEVIKALEDAIARKVKIQVLAGPRFDQSEPNRPFFKLLERRKDSISLSILSYTPPRHFMVVADKHYRKEKRHEECLKERNVRATIYYYDSFFAKSLSEMFDRFKEHSSSWIQQNKEGS